MTKMELVAALAGKFDIPKTRAAAILGFVADAVINGALADGRAVFGPCIFKKVEKAARKGTNPRTGQAIDIPAKTLVVMKYKA